MHGIPSTCIYVAVNPRFAGIGPFQRRWRFWIAPIVGAAITGFAHLRLGSED
jgi:hypothetical protein